MKDSPFNHLNGKHSTADTDVDGIHNNMKGGDAYGKGCMRDMLLQEPVPGEKQNVPVQYI